jgi:diguanylate cyclase (GGDEF)-like protein
MKIFDMVEREVIPVHISQPFYQAPTRDFRRYLLTLSKDKSFFVQISHNYFPIESIGREIREIREKNPHLLGMEVSLLVNDFISPLHAPWRDKKEYFEKFRRVKEKFVRRMIGELKLEISPAALLRDPQALLKFFRSYPLLYRIDSEKKEAVSYLASENLFNDSINRELIILRVRYDLSTLFESYRKEHNRLLLILLLSSLIALAIIFAVQFLYLRPIRKIINALADDREVDLGKVRIREFRQLSDVINAYRRNLYRRHRELEKLTYIDPLTGAFNRRYFEKILEEKIREAKEGQGSFALSIFDLDNFKKINDRYGHDMGDEILKKLAHLVREQLRKEDLFFRIGGEEFALLLSPAIRMDEIRSTAEGLRQSVENELPEEGMPVTISMGVALYHEGDDVTSLFRRADHAMYHSKERGKNRVTFA